MTRRVLRGWRGLGISRPMDRHEMWRQGTRTPLYAPGDEVVVLGPSDWDMATPTAVVACGAREPGDATMALRFRDGRLVRVYRDDARVVRVSRRRNR